MKAGKADGIACALLDSTHLHSVVDMSSCNLAEIFSSAPEDATKQSTEAVNQGANTHSPFNLSQTSPSPPTMLPPPSMMPFLTPQMESILPVPLISPHLLSQPMTQFPQITSSFPLFNISQLFPDYFGQQLQAQPKNEAARTVRGPYKKRNIQLPEEVYHAEKVAALCGRHPALMYRFEEEKAYSFMFKRQNKNGVAVYVCSTCKRKFNKEIKISAMNDRFLEDPQKISHLCEPLKWSVEAAKRKVYETTQKLRTAYTQTTPKEAYEQMLTDVLNKEGGSAEDKLNVYNNMGDLKKHRRAFSRAINLLRPKVEALQSNLDAALLRTNEEVINEKIIQAKTVPITEAVSSTDSEKNLNPSLPDSS